MNEATKEQACVLVDDLLLPAFEDDCPLVLPSRGVLRKQPRQLDRIRGDDDQILLQDASYADAVTRDDSLNRSDDLADDARVLAVHEDPHVFPGGPDRSQPRIVERGIPVARDI